VQKCLKIIVVIKKRQILIYMTCPTRSTPSGRKVTKPERRREKKRK
jgi:hypothetical protein